MPTYYYVAGVRIEIRTRENGHNEPHVHIIYAGESMSVSLLSGEILSGKIKNQKVQKKALIWISENVIELRKEWERIHD